VSAFFRYTAEAELFRYGDQVMTTETIRHDVLEEILAWYKALEAAGSVYRLTVTDNAVGSFRPRLPRDLR
jgi:hypothetical protein